MYLFELEFLSFLDICPGVGLLDHMVVLFLVFLRTSMLFSIVAVPIYKLDLKVIRLEAKVDHHTLLKIIQL